MEKGQNALELNLKWLSIAVNEFIDFFQQGYNYKTMIYDLWNAKDVLGHITFWHESFARNISDLGLGRKLNPLKGKLSEVNSLSVESTKDVSIKDLLKRFRKAQYTIEQYIFDKQIDLIPYKKGSRDYSRLEHLDIVTNHIFKHLKDLNKKIQNG